MIPFLFNTARKSFLSSVAMPLVAVAVIALTSSMLYLVNGWKSSGRTEAEFERLVHVSQQYVEQGDRDRKLLRQSLIRLKHHEETITKLKEHTQQKKIRIDALPKSASNICPIDCILPEVN